jgi:N-dimethylarginine dimethylaminohydrolase
VIRPVFLMSPPRRDWALRGRANPFAAASRDTAATDDNVSFALGDAARADWLQVALAIEAAGGAVVVVDNDAHDAHDAHGDARAARARLTGLPYTAEAGLCGGDGDTAAFVLPRLTPAHRRDEPHVVAPVVARLGLRTVTLPDDVLFEGQGDVVRLGTPSSPRFCCTYGRGRWARTNARAYDAIARFVGGPTQALPFHADPWFHGNTFLGGFHHAGAALVVVCDEALVDDGAARLRAFADGARFVSITPSMSLSYATNALQVGTTVLAPLADHGPDVPGVVVDAWRALGLSVRFLALPVLFGHGGGAAVCLTNRLDGVAADGIPGDLTLAAWRARQERR